MAGLVLLSTIAFTLGDYVFRSAVARSVEPAALGRFFASFYLAVNAFSIVAQDGTCGGCGGGQRVTTGRLRSTRR